jgi:hypothetical protein
MSTILGADGKPVEKKWEEMDQDEKPTVLRLGIGALIQQGNALGEQGNALGVGMSKIITAMEAEENAYGALDNPTHIDAPEPPQSSMQPPFLEVEVPTVAQPEMK